MVSGRRESSGYQCDQLGDAVKELTLYSAIKKADIRSAIIQRRLQVSNGQFCLNLPGRCFRPEADFGDAMRISVTNLVAPSGRDRGKMPLLRRR